MNLRNIFIFSFIFLPVLLGAVPSVQDKNSHFSSSKYTTGKPFFRIKLNPKQFCGFAFRAANSNILEIEQPIGIFHYCDIRTRKIVKILRCKFPRKDNTAVVYSQDRSLAAEPIKDRVFIYRTSDGILLHKLNIKLSESYNPYDSNPELFFSPDGKTLADFQADDHTW